MSARIAATCRPLQKRRSISAWSGFGPAGSDTSASCRPLRPWPRRTSARSSTRSRKGWQPWRVHYRELRWNLTTRESGLPAGRYLTVTSSVAAASSHTTSISSTVSRWPSQRDSAVGDARLDHAAQRLGRRLEHQLAHAAAELGQEQALRRGWSAAVAAARRARARHRSRGAAVRPSLPMRNGNARCRPFESAMLRSPSPRCCDLHDDRRALRRLRRVEAQADAGLQQHRHVVASCVCVAPVTQRIVTQGDVGDRRERAADDRVHVGLQQRRRAVDQRLACWW